MAVTFSLYYSRWAAKIQVEVLITASLVFYAWHYPMLLVLLLVSAFINIVTSYFVAHGSKWNKSFAMGGVVSNLLILGSFKYGGLFSEVLSSITSVESLVVSLPLPLGISFYTFQGISLVVDVYKERVDEKRAFVPLSFVEHAKRTLFFISFFPQLVAGPIVKAKDFLPQIKLKYLSEIDWNKCFKNIVTGYFLKMVVADNLKDFTFWIAYPYYETIDSTSLVVMLFGYSFQIFSDFAGYSLIAIGISGLFGYQLRDNFLFPYISQSFREFWKRWHISLSSFLQEYLYIPLGGNQKGRLTTYRNLFITMALGGLWHGAAWSYAVWGVYHGTILAAERFLSSRLVLPNIIFLNFSKGLFVFVLVSFGWLLFKLPEFSQALGYLQAMIDNTGKQVNISMIARILVYASPVVLYHVLFLFKARKTSVIQSKFDFVAYGLMLFLILTNSGFPGEFIYFQF